MYKKVFIFIFFCSFNLKAFAFETLAKYAVVLDYNNFDIVFKTDNIYDITTPSSMTKIMTAYLIFDLLEEGKLNLDNKFKVSIRAWRQEGSRMFLEPEKMIRIEDLLKGLIVQSGNDAAVALAEGSYETTENFIDKMNEKAKILGLKDTNFVNVNGLFHKNHYMSTYDVALLSYNLIKEHKKYYDMFFKMPNFEFNGIRQKNRNWLLEEYEGTDGIKTGHTDEGGYSLASSVEKNGQRFIVVVNGLKSERERINETKKLLDYAFSKYSYIEIYKKNEIIDTLDIKNASKNFVNIYTNKDIVYSTKKDNISNVKVEKIYNSKLKAPIHKDDIVGYIKITDSDKITKFDLLSKDNLEFVSIKDKLFRFFVNLKNNLFK